MTIAYHKRGITIHHGSVLDVLPTLADCSVNTCVASPPYWGLRDYGSDGQIGLEKTPEEYVAKIVQVFREVRRVLADDGTLWLNLGDTYNAYNGGAGPSSKLSRGAQTTERPPLKSGYGLQCKTLKPKDLIGIPWRVAFAIQADGWYLRSDIIWSKPNPMPESVTDRCTKSHEYIFHLSKSRRYYFDYEAIREEASESSLDRWDQDVESQAGSARGNGGTKSNGTMKAVGGPRRTDKQRGHSRRHAGFNDRWDSMTKYEQCSVGRNKRSVWTVATSQFKGAHFATFPPRLIEPCILAGCPKGGTVLDPFFGSGTTGEVSQRLGCNCVGIELNADYIELAKKRFRQTVMEFTA